MLVFASSISVLNKILFNKLFTIRLGIAFLVVVAVGCLKKCVKKVMGQFTHTGTVLYKESENQQDYFSLKGKAAIQEKLEDVKGAAFRELLANKDKTKSLLDAHMYFNHFEFETKVINKKTA